MRPICTICGRRTTPFLFIGLEPVGPSCARKLGITKKKVGRSARVVFTDYKPARETGPTTMDLFDIQGVA